MRFGKQSLSLVGICMIAVPALWGFPQNSLATKKDYQRYIEALLREKDFGTHYVEDGAADASVMVPFERSSEFHYDRPSESVIELIRLGAKSFPLLIECLSDGRLTSVRFDGNTIAKPMRVPIGYVCLDILSASVPHGKPIWEPGCNSDGLGACINTGFYFRPDDYWDCLNKCEPRPWVNEVQRNWKRAFLQNQLRFRNFYDASGIPEYKDLGTK